MVGVPVLLAVVHGQSTAPPTTTEPTFDSEIAQASDSDAATTQVPTGCYCVETGAANSTCSKFDCPCLCDLTAARCDPNCCCDAECSEVHTNYSMSTGACLENGTEADSINMCYDAAELFTVNAKFRMDKSVVGELLCVAVDNNPAVGTYYSNSEAALGDVDFSSEDGFRSSGLLFPDMADTFSYLVGDPVPFKTTSDADPLSNDVRRFLQLPIDGFDGMCTVGQSVGFMEDSATSCSRQVVDSSGECLVDPFASTLVDTLWLGIDASQHLSMSTFVEVVTDLDASSIVDFTTGVASQSSDFDTLRAWFAAQAATLSTDPPVQTQAPTTASTTTTTSSGATAAAATTMAPLVPTSPTTDSLTTGPVATTTTSALDTSVAAANTTTTTAPPTTTTTTTTTTSTVSARRERRRRLASCGCDYVLTQAKFTISYDDSSTITAATAVFTYAEGITSCTSVWIDQQFIVEFVPSEITFAQSFALGNFVERKKSGNPGYLVGLPVLSGSFLASSYEDVDELDQTLTVDTSRIVPDEGFALTASNSLGGCSDADSFFVPFGQNSSSECILDLDYAALETRCQSNGIFFENWKYNATYIGKSCCS